MWEGLYCVALRIVTIQGCSWDLESSSSSVFHNISMVTAMAATGEWSIFVSCFRSTIEVIGTTSVFEN